MALRSDSLTSDCRIPYGAITRSNRADAPERQEPDVAAQPRRASLRARPPRPPSARARASRPIDRRRNAGARARDGNRDASRAAPELENRPARARRHRLPELHVAAIERLRVLPVVEIRVVVPALPALVLRHWQIGGLDDCQNVVD